MSDILAFDFHGRNIKSGTLTGLLEPISKHSILDSILVYEGPRFNFPKHLE